MPKISKIQWTDATVNFWLGCFKVITECLYCYWYRDAARYGKNPIVIKRTSDQIFYAALKWLSSKKIFTCSWSDFFIKEADPWRLDAWSVIERTPWHSWQILTKRPDRILDCLPDNWGSGWDQVWLGVSVGTKVSSEIMIPLLLEVPAKTRFLSVEPLIEQLDLSKFLKTQKISWVIIGGESGNENGKFKYRPCEISWIKDVVKQCRTYNVPCFVKQLGTFQYHKLNLSDRHGGNINEFPTSLQVREFPGNLAHLQKNISII